MFYNGTEKFINAVDLYPMKFSVSVFSSGKCPRFGFLLNFAIILKVSSTTIISVEQRVNIQISHLDRPWASSRLTDYTILTQDPVIAALCP